MSTTDLAANVGVTRATIWNWTRAGVLPAPERRGRHRLYSPVAVAIARNMVEGSL